LHTVKAEAECREALLKYPNSKFIPEIEQMLRNIQEVRADSEMRVGQHYAKKGSYRAAVTRLGALTEQYPLFSKADDALWLLGESYGKMGKQFEDKSARAYEKLVREYPLSARVADAKDRLAALNRPIPDPDEKALAWMKYELENREKTGVKGHALGVFGKRPNVKAAAKSGQPPLVAAAPVIPEGITPAAPAGTAASATAGAETITGPSALDPQPDARAKPPAEASGTTPQPAASGAPATNETAPAAQTSSGGATSENAQPAQPESTSKKKKKGRLLKVIPRP